MEKISQIQKEYRKKTVIKSISLERDVAYLIESYKKQMKVSSLSPLINKLLKDWFKENYDEDLEEEATRGKSPK